MAEKLNGGRSAGIKYILLLVAIIVAGAVVSYLWPNMVNIALSAAFLGAIMVTIDWILKENRKKTFYETVERVGGPIKDGLDPSDILAWEFQYARTTASEALQDRHTMMNFYFIIAGGVILGGGLVSLSMPKVLAGGPIKIPPFTYVGTILLWLVCIVGWLYFLKLIRLRQAWRESARAMNQIKDFYLEHATRFSAEELVQAFRWRTETLPPPEKRWTVFFYSATLIALLDSVTFVAGGALLNLFPLFQKRIAPWIIASLVILGLTMFFFHLVMYDEFLRKEKEEEEKTEIESEGEAEEQKAEGK